MRIRFRCPSTARLSFQAGDEIVVSTLTEELKNLLRATRVDGVRVAEAVRESEEDITEPLETGEELGIQSPARSRQRRVG